MKIRRKSCERWSQLTKSVRKRCTAVQLYREGLVADHLAILRADGASRTRLHGNWCAVCEMEARRVMEDAAVVS